MGLSALAYLTAGLFLRQVFQTSLIATCAGAGFRLFRIKAMNMGPYRLHIYGLIPLVLLAVGLVMAPPADLRAWSRRRVAAHHRRLEPGADVQFRVVFGLVGVLYCWSWGRAGHRLGREWLFALCAAMASACRRRFVHRRDGAVSKSLPAGAVL